MAERLTAIFADQIADLALGNGLRKNGSDDTKFEVALKADKGLDFDTGEIEVLLDPDFLEFSIESGKVGEITIKNSSIPEAKLDIYNSPTADYVLSWDAVNGKMKWVEDTLPTGGLVAADMVVNEIPTGVIGSGNVTFTLAHAPVTGVQVFLNGLLQASGTGKDYTISGQTITFAKAPRANSEVYVTYFK